MDSGVPPRTPCVSSLGENPGVLLEFPMGPIDLNWISKDVIVFVSFSLQFFFNHKGIYKTNEQRQFAEQAPKQKWSGVLTIKWLRQYA